AGILLLLASLRLRGRRRRTADQRDPVLVVGERVPRPALHRRRALDGGDEHSAERPAAQQHRREAQRLPSPSQRSLPPCLAHPSEEQGEAAGPAPPRPPEAPPPAP